MPQNSAVNCPVHGTHGNLSNGKCWYCVQSGMTAIKPQPKKVPVPSTTTKVGTKRQIA